MMWKSLTILLGLLVLGQSGRTRILAECASFHDALNNAAEVAANGGQIAGPVVFASAVNSNGAFLNGVATVVYDNDVFVIAEGSLAFWLRKTSADAQGGILQLGTLATSNSFGFFYINQADLLCELRGADGGFNAIPALGSLSTSTWTHVVATWRVGETGTGLWLFIDGVFLDYRFVAGPFAPPSDLWLGATGFYGNGDIALDELRFFDWRLHDSEVYAEYVLSSNRHAPQPAAKPVSTGPVRVIGRSLEVEGQSFTVHGAGYQPTPVGVNISGAAITDMYTNPAVLARDLALLQGLHANVIRTWTQPPDTTLLDVMYNNGVDPIYTIIGFWIPTTGISYADPVVIATYENAFRNLVQQFKDHPGLLGWGIGNEINLTATGQNLVDWFALANRLAEAAYEEEGASYHPTIVVNGAMQYLGNVDLGSDDASLAFVDVWGHNLYFGEEPHCYFDFYDQLSSKPLIVTEFGIDAWDNAHGTVYPEVQADYVVRQWRHIEQRSAGGTVFEYSDEWWKAGDAGSHDFGGYGTDMHPDDYSNEEWWGLLAAQDNGALPDLLTTRLAYDSLAVEYAFDPGDVDGDGDVDLRDYALFQACLGAPADGNCGSALEFVVDGVISAADFAAFEQHLSGPHD